MTASPARVQQQQPDRFAALASLVPAPLRFIAVGCIGLTADLGIFSLISDFGVPALAARLVSLFVATLITWRLNRALTFSASGRRNREEALRYLGVTVFAQGASYLVFAALVLSVAGALPKLAIIAGAAIGAVCSYFGHKQFSFAPAAAGARGA